MSTETIKEKKEELIESLSSLYENLKLQKPKERKRIETAIKDGLKQYQIIPGEVQDLINDPSKLNEVGIDKVYFLSEKTYEVTKRSAINPQLYFTNREIKEIRTNFEGYNKDKIDFPYEFQNVIKINDDDYITSIKASEVKLLFENALLQYNPETQREAKQITRGDQIIEVPKINEKSVKEMVGLIEKGELISSVITLNARLGSSDEGEELSYDENTRNLTVTEGTLLDAMDGFHRINSIVRALRKNPSIDMTFKLNILNFDKKRAQRYFSQMNTTTPIAKAHLKKMSESRYADFIANYVQNNSELSGKVAAGDQIYPKTNLLVTFNTLSDSINDVYNEVEDKASAIKVSRYLTEFINTLFMEFPEEFLSNNISKIREGSLINANSTFFGYVLLSQMMTQAGIPLTKLKYIIDDIDFSRCNPMWTKKKLLNSDGHIANKYAKNIMYNTFKEIDLDKYK